MHRPGIASVQGDKVILDGTTLEEVQNYHRATLKLALSETNRQYREYLQRVRAEETAKQRKSEEHRKAVDEQARNINFDD